MSCLFCNLPEPNYKPESHIDFICGRCVILLADASQEDLKKAHTLAIEKGYLNKANAIESFLISEGKDEQRKPESKKCGRYSDRAGIIKSIGNQKERIKRVAV